MSSDIPPLLYTNKFTLMFYKLLCSAAIGLTALLPASAGIQPEGSPQNQQYEVVGVQGEQTDVTGDWVDSKEVNTVQESELTRKAIQAEKARNAAENDKYGGAITIIAMCIVVCTLVIISLLFMGFGKITTAIHSHKKRQAHGVTKEEAEDHHDEMDSGEAIAAIAMALAEHSGQGHDMEDTLLTIRRMKKAYSPWNSKIYNLRQVPSINTHDAEHHRTLK